MTIADAFWDAVIAPHLARLRPGPVLLAGGDGALVDWLLGVLADGFTLHIADKAPGYDVAAFRRQAGDRVVFHRADPLEAIGLLPVPRLLLLDPDPNHYTVRGLLLAAAAQAARRGQAFPVTLLWGTGWPHGRRDGYRDPGAIPASFVFAHERAGLRPGQAGLCAGSGLFTDGIHAVAQNVARCGVMTALEDAVSAVTPRLGFRAVPFLHGLSVVYPAEGADAPDLRALLDGLTMGEAAAGLAHAVETARCVAAAEAADLRRALASEQYRNGLLHENLRVARAGLGTRVVVTADEAPGLPVLARRTAGRAARLAAWAARGELGARRAEEATAREVAGRIARLLASPAFDAAWYLRRYPDVAASGLEAASHYYHFGGAEGRDPGPHFSGAYYLAQSEDVAGAGINPLLHYVSDGGREGRDPSAAFCSKFYLDANPDVAAAGINPLEHYLSTGASEGRLPK